MILGLRHRVGPLCDTHHVQNQRDPAVTHDAGAGERLYPLDLLAQRLDYDFLGIVDFIHDQSERLTIRLQYNDVHGIVGIVLLFF